MAEIWEETVELGSLFHYLQGLKNRDGYSCKMDTVAGWWIPVQ